MRRTDPMNSDDAAANGVNVLHRHVLEVALEAESLLARVFDELITELVVI
jgi:hypothetical protein